MKSIKYLSLVLAVLGLSFTGIDLLLQINLSESQIHEVN